MVLAHSALALSQRGAGQPSWRMKLVPRYRMTLFSTASLDPTWADANPADSNTTTAADSTRATERHASQLRTFILLEQSFLFKSPLELPDATDGHESGGSASHKDQ